MCFVYLNPHQRTLLQGHQYIICICKHQWLHIQQWMRLELLLIATLLSGRHISTAADAAVSAICCWRLCRAACQLLLQFLEAAASLLQLLCHFFESALGCQTMLNLLQSSARREHGNTKKTCGTSAHSLGHLVSYAAIVTDSLIGMNTCNLLATSC
jgi:hypothetical protein